MSALSDHLATGLTTLCRCWAVERRDGRVYGFTDHDVSLEFEGIAFRADTGLSAKALVQGTGLSVDNSEALGVLSDAAISEAEIDQGRFDGAEVRAWLVNWANVAERKLQFRGHIGEIRRGAGAFHAELRGLTELLNQPKGRVFQKTCSAVLGDGLCRVDLGLPEFSVATQVFEQNAAQVFEFEGIGAFSDRYFERGRLRVQSGDAAGLTGVIKQDRVDAGLRRITLWEPLRAAIVVGDAVILEAGCDKRVQTCKQKFGNLKNFRGYPHIPGEDWLVSIPRGKGDDDGGSLV